VADIIFVGKSLSQHGGQNPIEAAMYGKAVVTGPNMENFPSVMEAFQHRSAIARVDSEDALFETIVGLLKDPEARADLGRRAAWVVNDNRGVMERTMALLARE